MTKANPDIERGALVGEGALRQDASAHYRFSGVVNVAGFRYRVVAEERHDGQRPVLELRFRIARDSAG